MLILNIVLGAFVALELSNVLTLYFNPAFKRANGIGIFNAWSASKKDPSVHRLVQYLVYWVAGTKLIFLALLCAILLFAGPVLKMVATIVLALSVASFYWKMYPLVRTMDRKGEIAPKGYSKTLGVMIAVFIGVFTVAVVVASLFYNN